MGVTEPLSPQTKARLGILVGKILAHVLDRDMNCVFMISEKVLKEVICSFSRDLAKIDRVQGGSVSITKFAGYLCFWIRKLKPIMYAYPAGKEKDPEQELTDANEIAGLKLAIYFLKEFRQYHAKKGAFKDPIITSCADLRNRRGLRNCDGRECFVHYVADYFTFRDNCNWDYIIHSSKVRTFGPHHYVAIFDNLLFGACVHIRDASLQASAVK